jgi:hypothetical protein
MLTADAPLQSIVDPFVKGMGGELIADLIKQPNPPPNADYFFRRHNIVGELKTLHLDSFGEPFQRRLTKLVTDWHRNGRLIVFGRARIDSDRLNPELQRELWDVMARPLQKQVVLAANNQIRSTKELLGMPDAKGLLWVASDGNQDLQPNFVWYLLTRILQKRDEHGAPAYSHIHGLAYFSPRMLVQTTGLNEPALFWFSGARRNDDQQMLTLLKELSEGWPKYVEWAQGTRVRSLSECSASPQSLRFWGVTPRKTTIQIGQADGAIGRSGAVHQEETEK